MNTTVKSRVRFSFQLFIAGGTPNSLQAQSNLNALCRLHMADEFEIEVIDVFLQPERALAEGILMTPMLIVLEPGPRKRIAGTLSNSAILADALGLDPAAQ